MLSGAIQLSQGLNGLAAIQSLESVDFTGLRSSDAFTTALVAALTKKLGQDRPDVYVDLQDSRYNDSGEIILE